MTTSGCFRSCAAVVVCPGGVPDHRSPQERVVSLEPCSPLAEDLPALVGDEPGAVATLGQPEVCVVDAKEQPIFRAGREHPVRFETALGDQVVHENADVRLVAPKCDAGSLRTYFAAFRPATNPWAAASS